MSVCSFMFTPYFFQGFYTPMVSNIEGLPMRMVFDSVQLSRDDLSAILILQNNYSAEAYISPK